MLSHAYSYACVMGEMHDKQVYGPCLRWWEVLTPVMPEGLVGGAVTATKNGRLMNTWAKVWDMPEYMLDIQIDRYALLCILMYGVVN
jgi:hypothetical protein